jgi:hypothetical protein
MLARVGAAVAQSAARDDAWAMSSEAFYKVLGRDGRSCHGGKGVWRKNRWRGVNGPLVPCLNGLHLCRPEHLVEWVGPTVWRAEYDGEMIEHEHDDKIVARRARVTERIEAWNDRTARLFAADCAERVLHLYESEYPGYDRPRAAIQAARDFADGRIGEVTRDEAAEAAWVAARAAQYSAGAQEAAWAAARAAQFSARAAAQAVGAVGAAAQDNPGAVEREWQARRLLDYLEGRAG